MSRKRYPIRCEHLPEAHNLWRVLRSVLLDCAPELLDGEWTACYTSSYETAFAFEVTVDGRIIGLHRRIDQKGWRPYIHDHGAVGSWSEPEDAVDNMVKSERFPSEVLT